MKNSNKLIAIAIIIIGSVTTSLAQVTDAATATSTIITPIAITKQVDMNFGYVAVSSINGTVVLSPAGSRSKTGGITLPQVAGTVTAASFKIDGADTSTYSITIPSGDYTITRSGSAETMIVNTFTSTPSNTGVLNNGTQTVSVGATLNVGGSQVAGVYTNTTGFDVTVNYN